MAQSPGCTAENGLRVYQGSPVMVSSTHSPQGVTSLKQGLCLRNLTVQWILKPLLSELHFNQGRAA